MIREFVVNNFKSFLNVRYKSDTVNLLVGANNSGKTNLCQALQFLSWTAQKQTVLPSLKEDYHKNFYSDSYVVDFDCVCDLTVDNEVLSFRYQLQLSTLFKLKFEKLEVSGGSLGSDWMPLFENEKGSVSSSVFDSTGLDSNRYTVLSKVDSYAKIDVRVKVFHDYLVSWCYYSLDDCRLRQSKFYSEGTVLDSDGANLASVLYNFKRSNSDLYQQLLDLVSCMDEKIVSLNFKLTEEKGISFIEMQLVARGRKRDTASSGTLRFMALAYIILYNNYIDNPSLIIIENPDTGLCVRNFKLLFELIDPAGNGGQYIFTSHSPYFIDLFDVYIGNITVLKCKGTHSILLKPEEVKIREYLAQMSLGELHFRGMLV